MVAAEEAVAEVKAESVRCSQDRSSRSILQRNNSGTVFQFGRSAVSVEVSTNGS